ncbi:MAG TPA: preprotein translocase subunit YajC [Candidatus Cloacimonas sp.]|jgi:preprotein translocase subunit YajC|nr:preprotein translocase subunit YajC [Candidatus Cloacimonadota bacterium]HCX72515.1 preprotein translocase subunit YajC [Candidatus Cloacimonas sp.]
MWFLTLLQAGGEAGAQTQQAVQQPSAFASFLPFILMFVILYFLIIRPQRKRQKEHQNMLDNIQINDKIITNGGIIGKVVNIKNDKNTFMVRVDDTTNTKIELQKNAVAGILKNEEKKSQPTTNSDSR